MRFIVIPEDPTVWLFVGLVLLGALGYAAFRGIWPSAQDRVRGDARYREALRVYAAALPQEVPTREERRQAMAVATEHLTAQHALAAAEADKGLRVLVADLDRARSYDLRHDALAYEQAGAFELALELFDQAARLQEEHDAKDHQFLQRCIARVRGKVRPRKEEAG